MDVWLLPEELGGVQERRTDESDGESGKIFLAELNVMRLDGWQRKYRVSKNLTGRG